MISCNMYIQQQIVILLYSIMYYSMQRLRFILIHISESTRPKRKIQLTENKFHLITKISRSAAHKEINRICYETHTQEMCTKKTRRVRKGPYYVMMIFQWALEC